jgi:protein-disulfide isomerase
VVVLVSLAGFGATCKGNEPRPATAPGADKDKPADKPETLVKAPETVDIEGLEISEVPPEARKDFWRLLNETFCYCGCPRTLASCLAHKAECSCAKCSERMVHFILDQYRNGASTEDVDLQVVEGFSEGYNAAPRNFDLGDHPVHGSDKAKLTLVEFADFRCSHCREAAPVLSAFVQSHPDVRLAYYYFPLGGSESPSILVAEAGEEARVQGKFWEMHDLLFKNQQAVEEADLIKYAAQVGLDVEKFKAALQKHTHRERVLADKRFGEKSGVLATPTIFVNGRPFGLARTLENLKMRVEMEAERGRCE